MTVFVLGRGYISISELRHLLTSVGEKLSDEEAEELIKTSGCVDRTSGTVNYMSKYDTQFRYHYRLVPFHTIYIIPYLIRY